MNGNLNDILNANLSQEQKDILLEEYANNLLKIKKEKIEKEKTWEERNKELIEKNREKSRKIREEWNIKDKEYQEEKKKKAAEENVDKQRSLIEELYKNGSIYEINSIFHSNPDIMKKYAEKLDMDINELGIVYEMSEKVEPETIDNDIESKEEIEVKRLEIENKHLTDEQKNLKENIKKHEEINDVKLKVVDFEENMKKFPRSYSEFVAKGGLKPEPLRRMVRAIKNKYVEWKNRKAEVSEEQLLEKNLYLKKQY